MTEVASSPEKLVPSPMTDELQALQVDQAMAREDAQHQVDRLQAWRDANEWLKVVEPMRPHLGTPLEPETLALVMYVLRRLETQPGSLTRSRVMAATRADADVMEELARASDHSLETMRTRFEALHDEVRRLGDRIRGDIERGEKPSILLILEQLETFRSL